MLFIWLLRCFCLFSAICACYIHAQVGFVIPLAPCWFVLLFFSFFSHSVLLPDALFQLYTRWFDAQDGDVDLDLDVVPLVPYLNFAHVVFS